GLSGADRIAFLNGLVSNDVTRAVPGQAVWAALLTAQGRYLADFFIFSDGERLLLETRRDAVPALLAKLRRFKLRAAVELTDLSETLRVVASWDGAPPPIPITAPDPRLAGAGFRALSEAEVTANADAPAYDAFRLSLGLPDGPPDLEPEKTLLLEAGFDELGGVDWQKGCYMGQELTARTKYRGLVKRRLVPVRLSEPVKPGTTVLADGVEVGSLRSSAGEFGLANLRIDALAKELRADTARVVPNIPAWMRLPA
ncbi:MAG TPA: folate-binding protein, partial [Acidocella sp.]|nr:folate-binding protein [Acidocella sp.]